MTSYVETHAALIDAVRLWIRTTNFAHLAPHLAKPDKNGRAVYRSDSADTKIADALCDLWQQAGAWQATAGKKLLGKLAGVSPNTALAALRRLAPWFVVIEDAGEHGMRFTAGDLVVVRVLTPAYEELQEGVNLCTTGNDYSPRKARDPYQVGTSRKVRQIARDLARGEDMTPGEWLDSHNVGRGLGEAGLRVMDALTRCGEMTAKELAIETGKSERSVKSALVRLAGMAVASWEREKATAPKVWTLEPGAFASIEARSCELRTWGMAAGREDRRLEDAQQWAEWQHRTATTDDERESAWQRRERLAAQRAKVLAELHPEWSSAEAKEFAGDVPFRQWVSRRAVMAERKRQGEERAAAYAATQAQRAEVRSQVADLGPADAARYLRMAGYDAGEVSALLGGGAT